MSKLVYEYFNYQNDFELKYGINTIVLMQVGSFFEFYGYNEDEIRSQIRVSSLQQTTQYFLHPFTKIFTALVLSDILLIKSWVLIE